MALSFSRKLACPSARAVRPAAHQRSALRPARLVLAGFILHAEPASKVEVAIKEAEDACSTGTTGECAAAWDTVEEISAAVSHKKVADKQEYEDPLDKFCGDNPAADECRVYED